MARDTNADDGFDYNDYLDSLAEAGVESLSYVEPGEDLHDALTETAFETADQEVGYNSVSHSLAVLDNSQNEPDEWSHLAEGKDEWREVVRAMAFTVVRQDFYDALEAEGYLDDHWNPTDKLKALRDEE